MTDRKENLPTQGVRDPRVRRERGIVPAPLPSSSSVGLGGVLPAGTLPKHATAEVGKGRPSTSGLSRTSGAALGETNRFVRGRGAATSAPSTSGPVSPPRPRPTKKKRRLREESESDAGAPSDSEGASVVSARTGLEGGSTVLRGWAWDAYKQSQWGLPRIHPKPDPKRTKTSMEEAAGIIRGALKDLGKLRCFPAYRNSAGYSLVSELCPEARSSFAEAYDAIEDMVEMAKPEAHVERIDQLEVQVAGLKAALARMERALEKFTSKVTSKPGPPQPPAPPPKPNKARTSASKGGRGDSPAAVAPSTDGEWTTVVRGKKKKKKGGVTAPAATPVPAETPAKGRKGVTPAKELSPKKKAGPTQAKRRRAVPRNPVVSITTLGRRSYADIMKEARDKVSLADIGIDVGRDLTVKRARNGGYLLEISGMDNVDKADRLARDLGEALDGDALVARPVKTADMRVTGLDDSATKEGVLKIVCAVGGCPPTSVRVGEIRRSAGGLGAAWVRLPLSAALVLESVGRLRIGWVMAGVQMLEERPLQCYKCLHFGHMAAACKSAVLRAGRCFACGGADHVARGCTAVLRCSLCADEGRDAGHRLGGRSCPAARQAYGKKGPPVRKKPGGTRKESRREKGSRPQPPPPAGDVAASDASVAPPAALPQWVRQMDKAKKSPSPPSPTEEKAVGPSPEVIHIPDDGPSQMVVEEEGGAGDDAGVSPIPPGGDDDFEVEASGLFLKHVEMDDWGDMSPQSSQE